MSDTSSQSDNKKKNTKPVNYTTDYHVDVLQNHLKMRNADHPVKEDYHKMSSYASEKNNKYDDESTQSSRRSNSTRRSNSDDSISNYKMDEKLPEGEKYKSAMPPISEEENKEDDGDNYNSLSPEQQRIKKMDMLRKLGELTQYGVKLSQNYNMQSDYFIMKQEFELHTNIRAKQNSVNWMSSLMMNCIYGLEIMNEKYNPFDLKLNGWSQQINADANNYYEVFGEIYEKYNKPGKNMSPELKLMLMISGSALKFHLNKTLLSDELNKKYIEQNNTVPSQQIIDQMALAKMQEQQALNAEILRKKTEDEHNLAAQQVQQMQFLNQQQELYNDQLRAKQEQLDRFAKIKEFMERPQTSKPSYDNNTKSSLNSDNDYNNEIANRLSNVKNKITSRRNSHHTTQNNSQTSEEVSAKSRGSRKSKFQKLKENAIQIDI